MERSDRPLRASIFLYPRFNQLRTYLFLLVVCAMAPVAVLVVRDSIVQKRALSKAAREEILWASRSVAQQQKYLITSGRRLLRNLSLLHEMQEIRQTRTDEILRNTLASEPLFYNIGILNMKGDLVASAVPSGMVNAADRYYFRQVAKHRTFAVGDYAVSRTTGKQSIHFAHPIMRSGTLQGVLFAAYDLDMLGTIPEEARLSKNIVLTVTDRNGTVLYRYPANDDTVGKSLSRTHWEYLGEKNVAEGTFDLSAPDGSEWIHAFQRISVGKDSADFFIDVAIPSRTVFAAANAKLAQNLLTLFLVLLAATAAAWIIGSRRILKPAREAAFAAKQLAYSDASSRTMLPPLPGEFGLVSEAFNEMTAVLTKREEELRESEARYRAVIETTDTGFVALNENGVVTHANDNYVKLTGRSSINEVLGHSVLEWTAPYDMDRNREEVKKCYRDNVVRNLIVDYIHKDGTVVKVEINATVIGTKKGKTILTLCRDVTERKLAEDRLRASEAKFRAIIETAAEGILVADIAGKQVFYANPEICSILGYTANELLVMKVPDIFPAEEVPRAMTEFEKHAGGETAEVTIFCRRKDSSVVPVSVRAVPTEYEGRKCLIGFFTDITERHLLENEQLKTHKLEAIGTLAGGIAHDFNNLLQGVFGYISMAKNNIHDAAKAGVQLEQAEKALHLSVNLSNQLLTFAKGGKPQRHNIDLRPVIGDAVRFALSGSRCDFRLELAEDLFHTEADEGQISQVVQNIVLNADQAMPGGGTIVITAWNVNTGTENVPILHGAKNYIAVSIRDTGTGIPPEHLNKVFDPYFTTKEKGSGLGLATSYSIIKKHGGAIDVRSEINKGSVFTIYLPAADPGKVERTAPKARTWARQAKILVMDDDAVIASLAKEMLLFAGHEAECVMNGEDAVAIFKRSAETGKPFDIVILDLTIKGGMGGEETIKRLREIDPHIKAVVSSGYADNAVIANYKAHGFSARLNKPYRAEALKEVISSVLN